MSIRTAPTVKHKTGNSLPSNILGFAQACSTMATIRLVIFIVYISIGIACFSRALVPLMLRLCLETLSIRRSMEMMSWSCNMPLKNTSILHVFLFAWCSVKCQGIYKHTSTFSFMCTSANKGSWTSQLIFLKRRKVCLHCVLDLCTSVAIVRIGHTFTSHHMFFTDSV